MKYKVLSFALLALLLAAFIYIPQMVVGEERKLFIPDKALCAKMLRFGKQAYMRGQYLNAKEYFRKAVQADPASLVAWRYYDLATVFCPWLKRWNKMRASSNRVSLREESLLLVHRVLRPLLLR